MNQKLFYLILHKIYKFDEWHLTPADERPYAECIIRKINSILQKEKINGEIIEIGCGLGDIIANISNSYGARSGYDISKNVIKAARVAHPTVRFKHGSFTDIVNRKIGLAIAVNFFQTIDDESLRTMLDVFTTTNDVDRILLDTVPSPPYEYAHNYDEIMRKAGFCMEWRSHSFAALPKSRRHLLLYRKICES